MDAMNTLDWASFIYNNQTHNELMNYYHFYYIHKRTHIHIHEVSMFVLY